MSQALKNTPVETPKPPPGITFIRVNIDTGLPAGPDSPETITEAFIDSSIPREDEDHEKEPAPSGTQGPKKSPGGPPTPSGYYD